MSSLIEVSGDLNAAKAGAPGSTRQNDAARQMEQAQRTLARGAADFRAKFMAERAAKAEADHRAELTREAAEFRQAEAIRKAGLKKFAQEGLARPGPTKGYDGPDFGK